MSELQKLSEFCEYSETLEDMLCVRLVCGLAERRVQQCLLAERDPAFDKVLKIANPWNWQNEMPGTSSKPVHTAGLESIGWPSPR